MARKKAKKPTVLRDPTLNKVLEIMHSGGHRIAHVAEKSGISPTTLHNWDKGRTLRPQNVTMEFALNAMGYKRVIVKQ